MSADAPAAHAAAPLRERVRWHRSLRTRIAVWSGLITLLFLLLVTLASAAYLRAQILERARLDTRATTLDAAERLEMACAPSPSPATTWRGWSRARRWPRRSCRKRRRRWWSRCPAPPARC
ncbi:MAG TPA: hypothetical protein VFF91_12950 [Pseudoxanthomonas sp.]|nr:hypothetical protein [Pseudoxanthomonas sp.]